MKKPANSRGERGEPDAAGWWRRSSENGTSVSQCEVPEGKKQKILELLKKNGGRMVLHELGAKVHLKKNVSQAAACRGLSLKTLLS